MWQGERGGHNENYLLVIRFYWGFDVTIRILMFEVYLRYAMRNAGEQKMESRRIINKISKYIDKL